MQVDNREYDAFGRPKVLEEKKIRIEKTENKYLELCIAKSAKITSILKGTKIEYVCEGGSVLRGMPQ